MKEFVISGEILSPSGTHVDNILQGKVNVKSSIHGEISLGHEVRVNNYLQGSVTAGSSVSGEMLPKAGVLTDDYLQGEIQASSEPVENFLREYEGSYEIDPTKSRQILPTKDKLMRKDMTIQGIYYYEVTNAKCGKTVTIGRD